MAFPGNWMQIWIQLPIQEVSYYPASLFWFCYDRPMPVGWDPNIFAVSMNNWWLTGVGGVIVTTLVGENPIAAIYINGGGYPPYINMDVITGPNYTVGRPLPDRNGVIIQRFCNSTSRRERGRLIVPGIAASDVIDGHLNPAATANYDAAARTMASPVIDQGVVWTPVVASYASSAAYPITAMTCSGKIGVVMRRRPRFSHFRPPAFGPKTPPP